MVSAIVQVRMGSTRLPGKVLKDVVGKPMLWHLLNRLKHARLVDRIIIATTSLKEDDQVENFARENNLSCYRGEAEDVLARYYGAATQFNAEVISRICSDNPLIDPQITDRIIKEHLDSDADYTSNLIEMTYPNGLEVEVFPFKVLEKAHQAAKKDYEREHVTLYIYQHPDLFRLNSVEASGKLRRPDLRLTVDTEEDLRLIREIFERLYSDGQIFLTEEVIDLLDKHPELAAINAHVKQTRIGFRRK